MTARLLVRDLAQLATPAGREAPLRAAALGEVDVLEHAYVLCAGGSIEAVGRMRDLSAIDGEVWAKLDAGTEEYYRRVERTTIPLARVLENITTVARTQPVVIQSLFLKLDGEGPSPTEQELGMLTLVCSVCQTLERLDDQSIEADVVATNAGVLRYCKRCGNSTIWKLAQPGELPAVPANVGAPSTAPPRTPMAVTIAPPKFSVPVV